jgi:hypothetical protein
MPVGVFAPSGWLPKASPPSFATSACNPGNCCVSNSAHSSTGTNLVTCVAATKTVIRQFLQ